MKKTKCKTLVFSRITGYYAPTVQWNEGKASEFKEREEYKMEEKGEKDADRKTYKIGTDGKDVCDKKDS